MNEFKLNQLYIFRKLSDDEASRNLSDDEFEADKAAFKFDLVNRIKVADMDIFKKGVCVNFHFLEKID